MKLSITLILLLFLSIQSVSRQLDFFSIVLSEKKINTDFTAQTKQVTISSVFNWEMTSEVPWWITISTTSGTGDSFVKLDFLENQEFELRYANLVFTNGTDTKSLLVIQNSLIPFKIDTPLMAYSTVGGVNLFIMNLEPQVSWGIFSTLPGWLLIETTTGIGSAVLSITSTVNADTLYRSFELEIVSGLGSKKATIFQQGMKNIFYMPETGQGTISGCSGYLTNSGGFSGYPNSANGTVTIIPDAPGKLVRLSFPYFITRFADKLKVYNSTDNNGPLIGTYSDIVKPYMFSSTSPGGAITLNFSSDFFDSFPGFTAQISCISTFDGANTFSLPASGAQTVSGCNGIVWDEGNNDNYGNNLNGSLTILPNGNNKVALDIASFDIEKDDSLFIYDGSVKNKMKVLGAFSKTTYPLKRFISSDSTGALTLEMHSNNIINRAGFTGTIHCMLAGSITVPGIVTIPGVVTLPGIETISGVNTLPGVDTTTGINEGKESTVLVYPNPVVEILIIKPINSLSGKLSIEIYDCLGSFVMSKTIDDETTWDVSSLPNGLYFLFVKNANGYTSEKLKVIKNY